jgi:anti-sigma28 factor (negative regulator of flagellin synthesis)
MATVNGVNALNAAGAPQPPKPPAPAPQQTEAQPPSDESDTVLVSAAATAKQAVLSSTASEIRQEQVDAAKARLAEGTYKLQATVLQVAARVAAFIE